MQHYILRCKHCQKEYTYCTYGNGPEWGTEEGCSQDYCAECQKAINKALEVIPIKFKPIPVEINEPELFAILDKIKEEDDKKDYLKMTALTSGEYDNIDKYTHDGKTYYIEYNDDTPEERHLFVEMEYDILKKEITKHYWRADKHDDSYMHGRNMHKDMRRIFERSKIETMPLPSPQGKLNYVGFDLGGDDYTWKVTSKK